MAISIRVDALVCSGCGAGVEGEALKNLEKAGGRCRCGGSRFKATLTKTVEGRETSKAGDIASKVALGRVAERIATASSYTMEKGYELAAVEGAELVKNLALPPEKAVEWITGVLKAAAKANLRPDQKLCAECGEIFVVGRAAFLQEGFCSPMCMKKQRPETAAASTKPLAPAQVPCPKCTRIVKVRGGAGKCMYCGTAVTA